MCKVRIKYHVDVQVLCWLRIMSISTHAPTEESGEEKKEIFYNEPMKA